MGVICMSASWSTVVVVTLTLVKVKLLAEAHAVRWIDECWTASAHALVGPVRSPFGSFEGEKK